MLQALHAVITISADILITTRYHVEQQQIYIYYIHFIRVCIDIYTHTRVFQYFKIYTYKEFYRLCAAIIAGDIS